MTWNRLGQKTRNILLAPNRTQWLCGSNLWPWLLPGWLRRCALGFPWAQAQLHTNFDVTPANLPLIWARRTKQKKIFLIKKKIQFTYNITLVSSVGQWFDIDSFCIVYIFSSLKLRWINAMAGHNCQCSLLLANINTSNIFKSTVYWIQLVEYNFSIIWVFFSIICF